MKITERQGEILNRIIQEYINRAKPVSSELLERKCKFSICPATIRIEMQKLTEQGYLFQPHTSAGRIPTDKGYRFYVDELLEEEFLDFDDKKFFEKFKKIEKEIEDSLKFVQVITQTLASVSSNLALGYLSEKDFLWKEGWGEIFREPEFRNSDFCSRFIKMVNDFEKEIKEFSQGNFSIPKIYIGKENPIPKSKEFSMIISRCPIPQLKEGVILTILGPKRMAYQKNIGLMNSLIKLLAKY